MTKKLLTALFFSLYAQSVFSADLYSIEITSDDSTDTISQQYTNIDDLIDATKQRNITLAGYNQNSEATISLQLGNTPAIISYEADSAELTFSLSSCGINQVFSDPSRSVNENSLAEYFHDNEGDIRDTIATCLFEENPHNPLAVTFREWVAFGDTLASTSSPEPEQANFNVGLVAGHFSTGDQSHSILTLPLSYTHYFEEQGRKLQFTAPLSYIDVSGSKAYKGSFGVAYTKPINKRWTIIPATRIGITASHDMGTSSSLASALVTNIYEFPYGNKHITLANMVGLLSTIDLDIGSLDSYFSVSNQVLKNGVSVEFPQTFNMFGGLTSIQASLANTQFFGDKMNVDNYTDIAVSFGTRRKVGSKDNSQDSIQLGLTYTLGNNGYQGGKINFGYEF